MSSEPCGLPVYGSRADAEPLGYVLAGLAIGQHIADPPAVFLAELAIHADAWARRPFKMRPESFRIRFSPDIWKNGRLSIGGIRR